MNKVDNKNLSDIAAGGDSGFVPSADSDSVVPPVATRTGTGGSGPSPEVDSRSDGNVNPGQG